MAMSTTRNLRRVHALFHHFTGQVRGLTGSVYGRDIRSCLADALPTLHWVKLQRANLARMTLDSRHCANQRSGQPRAHRTNPLTRERAARGAEFAATAEVPVEIG